MSRKLRREARRAEAATRKKARAKRTDAEQLAKLAEGGYTAKKESYRLEEREHKRKRAIAKREARKNQNGRRKA